MSSIKPDKAEINALRKKRGLYEPRDNVFSDIYLQCRIALDGGYITKDRAIKLLSYLEEHFNIRSIFPNNLLYEMLKEACGKGGWSSDNEGMLLDFIATFYLNYSLEGQALIGTELSVSSDSSVISKPLSVKQHPEIIRPPDIHFPLMDLMSTKSNSGTSINSYIYNSLPDDIDLNDCFVGVTGKFDGITRKSCSQEIRKLGGVPADPSYFLDYLFVANKSIKENAISNQCSASIDCRRVYGNPLILMEDDWRNVILGN